MCPRCFVSPMTDGGQELPGQGAIPAQGESSELVPGQIVNLILAVSRNRLAPPLRGGALLCPWPT